MHNEEPVIADGGKRYFVTNKDGKKTFILPKKKSRPVYKILADVREKDTLNYLLERITELEDILRENGLL